MFCGTQFHVMRCYHLPHNRLVSARHINCTEAKPISELLRGTYSCGCWHATNHHTCTLY